MEDPCTGQIWVFNPNPARTIKLVVCDNVSRVVTEYEDAGEHHTIQHRPISYMTLSECWHLAGSRREKEEDERGLCELKRGALYVMKAPSERKKGRIIRLLQWHDDLIPGEGEGYEDHGTDAKQRKGLSISRFRSR